MDALYQRPEAGCYRLPRSVRIVAQQDSSIAICSYPLRFVRVSSMAAQLLSLCEEERTCEQLAMRLRMPVARIEVLCEQLRWKGLLEAGPMPEPIDWPAVSIIIPSYNRARELQRCLRSLLCLDYPKERLEIIVVDDASTDETHEMVQSLSVSVDNLTLRLVSHAQRQGVAIGRNTGAAAACYDLIAYIDSDCVASPGWLKELVPAFQDACIAAVGGMIRAYDRTSPLGCYEDVCSSLFTGVQVQQIRLEGPFTYLPTANLLVQRRAWQRIEGFARLSYGEDVDFCRRLLLAGMYILYLPQGVIYHDYRTTMKTFLAIRASYASAEATLMQHHPEQRRVLVLPPEQATFAGLAITGLWGLLWSLARSLLAPSWQTGVRDKNFHRAGRKSLIISFFATFATLLWSVNGVRARLHKVRVQRLPVGTIVVFKATLRGHLSYTYHLCRHLTRYYTLPLLLLGLLFPPILVLILILCSIVIGVDYVRLRPSMRPGEYALCSLLADCAYEIGVIKGCIKHRTWKPLVPVCRRK